MANNLIMNNIIFFTALCQDWRVGSDGLLSFQGRDTKLERMLAKNQHAQRKKDILSIDVVGTSKVPNPDFQSQFKFIRISDSDFFFHRKMPI